MGKTSTLFGLLLTVAVHLAALLLVSFTGLDYLYPPPAETSFVMEFESEEEENGEDPASENTDPESEVELVKKSESPYESRTAENRTPAVKENGYGDVEIPEVKQPEEPKLDPRASFPGMSRKDTTATSPHAASQSSGNSASGKVDGNVKVGSVEGRPNVHVEGRTCVGALPLPGYKEQKEGKVVVRVTVLPSGKVKEASAGAPGTTVTDSKLWAAARNAAMETRFNVKADAPAEQTGTITYIFKLK